VQQEREYTSDIQRQRAEILELEQERLTLAAQGSAAEAAEMEPIIAARKLALQIQMQTGEEEVAANIRAEELVRLKQEAAAADEARAAAATEAAAADTEDAATGNFRGLGQMGRGAGMLGGALGMGASMAGAVGLGVFGGYEAYEYINRQTEAIEKEIDAQNRMNEAFDKQFQKLQGHGSMEQWDDAIDAIHEKIQDLLQERQTAEGDVAAKLDEQIQSLTVQEGFLVTGARQAAERKETEDQITASIKAQTAAIGEQEKAWQTEERARNQAYEATQKQASLEEQHAKLLIDLQVAQGKVSPEEGDKQKASLDEQAARDQFKAQKKKAEDDIKQYRDNLLDAYDQARQAQDALDATEKAQKDADNRVHKAKQEQDNAGKWQSEVNAAEEKLERMKAYDRDDDQTVGVSRDPEQDPAVIEQEKQVAGLSGAADADGKGAADLKAAQAELEKETARKKALLEEVKKANDALENAQEKAGEIPAIQDKIKSDSDQEKVREENAGLKDQIEAVKAKAEEDRKALEEQTKVLKAQLNAAEQELRSREESDRQGGKGASAEDPKVKDLEAKVLDLQKQLADINNFGNPQGAQAEKAALDQAAEAKRQAEEKARFDAMVKQYGTPGQIMAGIVGGSAGLTSQPWSDNKQLGAALTKAEQAQKGGNNAEEMQLLERIVSILTAVGQKSTNAADKGTVAKLQAKCDQLEMLIKDYRS
jgi:hypothetical protein